jgi:D-alanine-D-alanine ligase
MNHKKKVLVIFGGKSSEHEISRISATSILKNINREKFDVFMMGITKEGKWLPYEPPLKIYCIILDPLCQKTFWVNLTDFF